MKRWPTGWHRTGKRKDARKSKQASFRRLSFQALEARQMLAAFTDTGTALDLVLGTNEKLSIKSGNSAYELSLGTTGTWSGTNDSAVTGSGTNEISVQPNALWTSGIVITDAGSGGGDAVAFIDSSQPPLVNAYANSMTVTLTNSSTGPATPGLSFDGTSVFTTGHSLTAAVNGDVIVNSGATLGATGGAFTLSASGAGSSLTVDGAIVGKSVALASAGDASVAQGASVSATSGILSIKSTGTNSSLTADGDVSTTGGPITLQSTGAVTVGVGVTVDSGAGLLTLAADVTAAGNGDDGVGTLAIDAGATIVSSDASPSAITLRGADVNIDTSGNAAVLGASRELVAPANNTLTGVVETAGAAGSLALAFDSSGNLYVAAAALGNGTISKFAPGSTKPTAALTGIDLFDHTAMAFDPSGNLYVLNIGIPGTVSKFAAGGLKPIATLGPVYDVDRGLAIDASGNVYVGGGGWVYKFAPNSTTPTAILSGFGDVSALAVDASGNLYVADQDDDTVTKFAPNSTAPMETLTGLAGPDALAFDAEGDLFVANYGDELGDGTTVSEFAPGRNTSTATLSGLDSPDALVFDPSGNLYVDNAGGGYISKFTPDSNSPSATLYGDGGPMAVDASGNLYVGSYGGFVSEFAPNTETINQAPVATYLESVDSDNNLYLATDAGIEEFAPGSTTPDATLPTPDDVHAMAVSPTGELVVGGFSGAYEITPAGEVEIDDGAGDLAFADAVAFDSSGDLYVAYSGYEGERVNVYLPGATEPVDTLTGLDDPAALAFDSSGDVFVANYDGNTVSEFALNGFVPVGNMTPTKTLTGLNQPAALAFDSSGNLFVANEGGSTVSEFAPGSLTPDTTLNTLSEPHALAVDSNGDLFVGCEGAGVTGGFAGSVLEFAAGGSKPIAAFGEGESQLAIDSNGNVYDGFDGYVTKYAPATPVAVTGGVTIQSSLESRPMEIGGSNNAAVAGINLTSAELAQIATMPGGSITFGDTAQTGDITFTTATPATTEGATLNVLQATSGPGQIILDEGPSSGTALDGNRGTVNLTPGTGGIQSTLSASGLPLKTYGFNATGTLHLALDFAPSAGTQLTIVDNISAGDAPIGGSFSNLQQGEIITASYLGTPYSFQADYQGGTGNDLVLTVVRAGPVLTVNGTSGADTTAITFSSAADFSVTINGTTSNYSTQNINQIIVMGQGGADTLTVSDTYNTGVGTWNPQFMQWNTAMYQISAVNTEDIAFTGKQGDSATLNGTTGSDKATLASTFVEMLNTGLFDNQVTGFGSAQVNAGSTAATAAVQDSGGGAVVGSAAQTSLSGTGYSYVAKGFQHVTATAGSDSDTVQLNASAGYTVATTANSSVLTGPGGAQVIVATGFASQQQPPTAVVQSGPVLTVTGTAGADTMAISFSSAAAFSITVNGATSSYSTQNINQIIVHGLGGTDTLAVSDTFNTGVGTWNPQFMQWNTAMYQISAVNTEDIAFTGKQGDSATLNGSTGSDQATLTSTSVEMLNTGLFDNKVAAFGSAQVNAGSTAATAAVQDSGGGAVVGSATQTSLSGTGYSYAAKGFQHVTATAGSDSDTVQLNASAGYTVATTASSSVLTGPGGAQVIVATGFASQQQPPPTAVVQSGPVLTVTGTSGADTMTITFSSAAAFSITVNGTTSSYSTQNINQIIVHGLGGADTLAVSDTYNTGVGTWNPQFMQWNTAKYQISADKTLNIAFTGNQNDSATLNGTTGSDQATLTATSVEMANTPLFDNKVNAFGSAQVNAGSSAATAAVQDSGGGAVVGSATQTSLSGTGYSYVAKGFQHVTATAGSGSDTVQLNASPGYTVATQAGSSVLTGPGGAQVIVATGFAIQQQPPPTAVVQSGPVLTVTGTSGADTMAISFSSAAAFSITVNGATSSYSTQNINQVIVHGLGGTDTLTVSDTFNTGVGTWNPQFMQWNTAKYQISADKTQAIAFTGNQNDSATLNGTTGSDQATLTTTSVEMANTALFDNKLTAFGSAQVVAGSAAATAAIQDSGGGAVVGSAAQTSLSGTGYSYVAKGFQHVTATAGSGSDTVQLNASPGYTVATTAGSSVLTGPGGAQVIVATGFASQQQPPPTAVVQSGPVLTVTGTSGADTMAISFSSAAAFSITVNGTTSSYSTQNINQIIVHGLGGTDTLAVSDTFNTGVGTWNPQFMQWNTAKYQISADKTLNIAFTGNQNDSATLNGTTGSDQATLTTTSVEMANTALFDNKVTAFGSAQVNAGSSAATAVVQDSGGGAVVGSAAQTSLSGTGYSYAAKGFQHVTATAGSDSDTVQLNASPGYTVAATANSSVLTGPGGAQVIVATGFASQQQPPPTAVVQSGPVLTVTGTSGADTMTITFSSAAAFSITVNGTTSSYSTQNINQIIVHGLGGTDALTVSDTFNTGVGTWNPQFMQWNTAKYQISADKTLNIVFTGNQNDSATLNGTTGSDKATLTANSVEMANTALFDNKVTGFGSAQVIAGSSAATAAISDSGGGAVVGSATQASLSGTGYHYVLSGFQYVSATAGSPADTVQLNASPGYTVTSESGSTELVKSHGTAVILATGFASTGPDSDILAATDSAFEQWGN
ncbi:MAG TPA: hypothetical protein VHV55_17040 [Pirellulales bacterium]|nr:hypothetical protein [Pirellulales bacterium]